jgi:hypothetical protein
MTVRVMFALGAAVLAFVLGLGPLRSLAVRVAEASGPLAQTTLERFLPQVTLSELTGAVVAVVGPILAAVVVLATANFLRGVARVLALVASVILVAVVAGATGTPFGALVALPVLVMVSFAATARLGAGAATGLLAAGWWITAPAVTADAGDTMARVVGLDEAAWVPGALTLTGFALWLVTLGLFSRGR